VDERSDAIYADDGALAAATASRELGGGTGAGFVGGDTRVDAGPNLSPRKSAGMSAPEMMAAVEGAGAQASTDVSSADKLLRQGRADASRPSRPSYGPAA
jgi:hypothetical protein